MCEKHKNREYPVQEKALSLLATVVGWEVIKVVGVVGQNANAASGTSLV